MIKLICKFLRIQYAPVDKGSILSENIIICYTMDMGNHRAGRLPSFSEGLTLQTKERRALPMMITYSDLVQTGIFIVALIGLCYTIFKGKRK